MRFGDSRIVHLLNHMGMDGSSGLEPVHAIPEGGQPRALLSLWDADLASNPAALAAVARRPRVLAGSTTAPTPHHVPNRAAVHEGTTK